MKVQQQYTCDICGLAYNNEQAAATCEARGLDDGQPAVVNVGDIVFTKAGFGWFDGDRRWVANLKELGNGSGIVHDSVLQHARRQHDHGNCFGECCTYQFYYVVTAIDTDKERDGHRRRYHIRTKAMAENGHNRGYTFAEGHYRPVVVKHPPVDVVADSKDLIGLVAEYLL